MRQNPSNTPEKKDEYRKKLQGMTDDQLRKETEDKIWFSAYAANNPNSCFHWQCDFTYAEWERRGRVDLYQRCHDRVWSEA